MQCEEAKGPACVDSKVTPDSEQQIDWAEGRDSRAGCFDAASRQGEIDIVRPNRVAAH